MTGYLLDQVSATLRRFVVLSDQQRVALALWVAHTHSMDAADTTPYIGITSPEKSSGKSRLLEVLELLVNSPLPTANISDAALFRVVAERHPTLLFDEIDAIFGAKARDREDLRGMLNAGYRRGAVVFRCGGSRMTELEQFEVFAPKAFAGIGDCLPDTIVDRSITIRLQRRLADEHIERFRRRDAEASAAELRDRLADWVAPQIDHLRDLRPALPAELDDRAQDVWEPLFAIADLADGEWPARARSAAIALSSGEGREDESLTAILIRDVWAVFEATGEVRLCTSDLIEHLAAIEESPWGDWRGKPITPHALSKLLKPHRIKTMSVWIHRETKRGYKVEQFADAFARVGSRGGRSDRSGIAPGLPPATPTAPTTHGASGSARSTRIVALGDRMYPVVLANAQKDGHLTLTESRHLYRLHMLVEACAA